MKPKAKAVPTAAEKRHLDRIAALGCIVCGTPAAIHHVVSDGFKRLTRRHNRVTPLCPAHHTDGPLAVHRISHAQFTEAHGIDLLAWADRAWQVSLTLEKRRNPTE